MSVRRLRGVGAAAVGLILPACAYASTRGPASMMSNGGTPPIALPVGGRSRRGAFSDYSLLAGRGFGCIKSFGREAGEFALQGIIPRISRDGYEVATFAGGCFWGTELHFQRMEGVVATCVGYTQGRLEVPSYDEVCSGRTGHTEAVQLIFDPKETSYRKLCEKLLSIIDPTALNRVGNDVGTQYRHGIYFHSEEQRQVAESVLAEAQERAGKRTVVTELGPAALFWPAEEVHQQYLQKGGRFGNPQKVDKGCRDSVRCYG